jgi:hypothetical protein
MRAQPSRASSSDVVPRRHRLSLRRLRAPSPGSALAAVALFFALSGSVVAATKLARGSVGSTEIKNGSIRAADLAKDTLTGTQIDEEQLGVVPRAAAAGTATSARAAAEAQHAAAATRADKADKADRATTADRATRADEATTLAGRSAEAFAASDEVFPVALGLAAGESRTLVERDGLRFVARCNVGVGTTAGGTADVLSIFVESSNEGASFSGPRNELDGSSGNALGPATPENKRLAVQQSANSGVRVVRVPGTPVSATSAGGTSIFLGSGGAIRVAFNSYGAVCSVSAPVMVTKLR